jgi:3'-phosphoadenosine 5'-phosphosulfate (PAPS) 3'-phosphatase
LNIDQAGTYQDEVSLSDVAIWIDPIDGTKDFIKGDVKNVTNMIGITVKDRPKFGIIHKPFLSQQPSQQRTYVGSVESGLFYFDHSTSSFTTSSPVYMAPFESNKNAEEAQGHYSANMLMSTDFGQS